MTPSEIQSIVYSTIQPYDVIQAVLQQEVTLYCGRLISTNPELFRGRRTFFVYQFSQEFISKFLCPRLSRIWYVLFDQLQDCNKYIYFNLRYIKNSRWLGPGSHEVLPGDRRQ